MGSDQAPEVVPESACWVIPVGNNWSFFKGVLHLWQTGCLWQDMHERYDKWNSVCLQFRRWSVQGIWDALLQALVDHGLTDDWQHIIDSTTVRSHVSAVSGKGGLCVGFWWITQRLSPISSAQANYTGKRVSGPPPKPNLPAIRQTIIDRLTRPPDTPCPHCGCRPSQPKYAKVLLV